MSAPLRVLVVEDETMTARLHELFIEGTPGFTTAGIAPTAQDAFSALDHFRVDVVLLDMYLPDGSGLRILEHLRTHSAMPVDVIAVTADNSVASINTARMLGVVHYLVKPFTAGELRARLYAVARAREAAAGQVRVERQGAIDLIASAGAVVTHAVEQDAPEESAPEPVVEGRQDHMASLRARAFVAIEELARRADCSPSTVAAALHVSTRQLQRAFAQIGVLPQDVIREQRTQMAAAFLLQIPVRPMAEIARLTGFGSTASLRRAFQRIYGCSPLDWRAQRLPNAQGATVDAQNAPGSPRPSMGSGRD